MDNQHKMITGYRDLSADEIELMNAVKAKAEEVRELFETVYAKLMPSVEPSDATEIAEIGMDEYETERWMMIAQDHLQQGFMALNRAIAKPTTF